LSGSICAEGADMPHKSTKSKIRLRIFRRRSASFTKIDELSKEEDEAEAEAKTVASSSKTWTTTMGRSLRKKLSAFRKDIDESDSPAASKSASEGVNVIYLRKPSSNRNGTGGVLGGVR
uniref:DUF4797 domain-containing protein n=1 Tax=Gongylonema pulchrum TaxID=637853 RepID=A0A183E675_9BILA